MILRSIELESFRNLKAQGFSLHPRGGVLEAPNGRGKTNFLEALHYLTLFRSFRGARDAELPTFGARSFHLRGEALPGDPNVAADGDSRTRSVGVSVEGARKRVAVDGRVVRPVEQIGAMLTVILSPVDIRLVQGSPARRRKYLDILLSLCSRRYLRSLQEYRRVLKQRNRVLQTGRGVSQLALLEPWTEQLVRHGALLLAERTRFFAIWAPRLAEIGERLAGGSAGRVTWRYESRALGQEGGGDASVGEGASGPFSAEGTSPRVSAEPFGGWDVGAEVPLQLVPRAERSHPTDASGRGLEDEPLTPACRTRRAAADADAPLAARPIEWP